VGLFGLHVLFRGGGSSGELWFVSMGARCPMASQSQPMLANTFFFPYSVLTFGPSPIPPQRCAMLSLVLKYRCHTIDCGESARVVHTQYPLLPSQYPPVPLQCFVILFLLVEYRCHEMNGVRLGWSTPNAFSIPANARPFPGQRFIILPLFVEYPCYIIDRIESVYLIDSHCLLSTSQSSPIPTSDLPYCPCLLNTTAILWTITRMLGWFTPNAFCLPKNTQAYHSSTLPYCACSSNTDAI